MQRGSLHYTESKPKESLNILVRDISFLQYQIVM